MKSLAVPGKIGPPVCLRHIFKRGAGFSTMPSPARRRIPRRLSGPSNLDASLDPFRPPLRRPASPSLRAASWGSVLPHTTRLPGCAVIVATAGHVDHGKTALVRALTGVDTDRLPEEKRRGLTIDLGFAYHPLDSGHVLGFVDVPGHERFVRNMLAGVGAVDLALVVVAADDGVMPQTREHAAILDLLGVTECIAVVSKTDKVGVARAAEVCVEADSLLSATGMRGAEVHQVSVLSGAGMDALAAALRKRALGLAARAANGRFRLCIDRVFTLKGTGLVVTGTVHAGVASTGERLVVTPGGHEARIRGIHAQDRPAGHARAGERCALNLSGRGIGPGTIARGAWVVDHALHAPSDRIDVRLRVLPGETRALRHWTPVHVHLAASHSTARVAVLGAGSIAPGGDGRVQVVLDRPLHVLAGDRIVIRDQSATRTMGGGMVIDPFSPRRGRARPARLAWLDAIEGLGPEQTGTGARTAEEHDSERTGARAVEGYDSERAGARTVERGDSERAGVRAFEGHDSERTDAGAVKEHAPAQAGVREIGKHDPEQAIARVIASAATGVDTGWIRRAFGITAPEMERMLPAAGAVQVPDTGPDRCFSPAHWADLQREITAFLETFHRERPRLLGANANDVRLGVARRVSQGVVEHALAALLCKGAVSRRGVTVRLPGHRVTLGANDERLWPRVARTLDPAGGSPPSLRQAAEQLKIDEAALGAFLKRATGAGLVLPVTRTRFVPLAAVGDLAVRAESLADASPDGRFTAAEYKDHARIGRNFAIELLEFFDRNGFTERLGDRRRIRRPAAEIFGAEGAENDTSA